MSDAGLEAAARLHREGRLDEALARYAELPRTPEVAFRVALVQAQRGDLAAAGESLATALAASDDPRFRLLQADLSERRGDSLAAVAALRAALALNPAIGPAHARLAILLHDAGDTESALAHFEAAAELDPKDARARANLARACETQGTKWLEAGRVTRAQRALERATSLDPGRPAAWLRLAAANLHLGQMAASIAAYERAELLSPPDVREIAAARLVAYHYDPRASREALFEAHRDWARLHARPGAPVRFANARDPNRKLRVGYVSPRFHESSLLFLLEPVLARHDPEAIEIHCYANQEIEDEATRRFRALAKGWVDATQLDDAALAARMRADAIDIAVDLAGHTPGSRVAAFAQRPAPVTLTWLDYFDTTGVEGIDYILTDAAHSPPDDTQQFSEQRVRLPRIRYAYQPPDFAPPVTPPPSLADPSRLVLGSFNRMAKISAETLVAWSQVLQRLPHAVLVVKNSALGHEEDREVFAAHFRVHGIDPARVEWRGYSGHAQMLSEYAGIDIALDTFPYTGGITTLEALWMGRPVVTLRGDTLLERQGAAIVSEAGLGDLVATDAGTFADIVAALAADKPRLEQISSGLRERMRASALLDVEGMARTLESTYRDLWARWLERTEIE